MQNARGRLAMLAGRRMGPRRLLRAAPNGRAEAPVMVNGALSGLVVVPPGRAGSLAGLRAFGPALAFWSAGLLIAGASAAALFIFGPVRRRLLHLEDAAT
jgi:hypothetical protein